MKKKIKILIIAVLLVTSPVIILAQSPPHPNNGANPGVGNGPVGGGAPIGNGLCILLVMGGAYGFSKLYKVRGTDLIQQ